MRRTDSRPTLATLQRLPAYRDAVERAAAQGLPDLTATSIAREVSVSPLVVRKDLESIGARGRPRRGFPVAGLRDSIAGALGGRALEPVVLVGVGALGTSLLRYRRFARYGLDIIAGFDSDRRKTGRETGGRRVLPMGDLPAFVRSRGIVTAVLTVPGSAAQEVTEQLVRAGIRGILNFAPVRLEVPDGVLVGRIEVAAALAVLHHRRRSGGPRGQRPAAGEDLLQLSV